MKILKSKDFKTPDALTTFVMDNSIDKEDIFTIKAGGHYTANFTLFFYADSEVKEKERNFWGNLEE